MNVQTVAPFVLSRKRQYAPAFMRRQPVVVLASTALALTADPRSRGSSDRSNTHHHNAVQVCSVEELARSEADRG